MPGGDKTRKFLTGWLNRLKRRSFIPRFFIRICRRPTQLAIIVNSATAENIPLDHELIDRLIGSVMENDQQELSVYESQTDDPLDVGHALAIIAATISSGDFRKYRGRKQKKGTTCGSLIIPRGTLPNSRSYKFTPWNNLDFSPADNRHYDIHVTNPKELAKALLSGLRAGTVGWTYLDNQHNTYRFQAIIAHAHCTYVLGQLQVESPPPRWKDGLNLTAIEQIETLRHLSGVDELHHPKKS